MAYKKYYTNGWADNEAGKTPITAASLNWMEDGIADAQDAAEAASTAAADGLTSAKAYSDSNLDTAKKYSDTNLGTAKSYADGVLTTAKGYTDQRETALTAKISTNASAISGLETCLGGLAFVLNQTDLGLDIVID